MQAPTFTPHLLKDQVAFITGGGSGIGAGIACALAAHGAKVALLGRKAEKLEAVAARIHAAGGAARACPADVRDFAALQAAIDDTRAALGRLDILINCAAGNFLAPAATLSAGGFAAVVDIDLKGTFHACRAAFPHLRERGGVIINITAPQAAVPMPLQCHAGAAKAGIEKLTRDLALEWGPSQVRVNAVSPGATEGTEGMARLRPSGDSQDRFKQRLPLQRYTTPEEVAGAVLFLCSPAAAYVTGASLAIDGGMALLGAGSMLELMGS